MSLAQDPNIKCSESGAGSQADDLKSSFIYVKKISAA